jgi:peroxiredoxin/uncharacterized membrane protein YphA (DoxX/SURF4 family)
VDLALLIARIILALVFAVAGLAKVADLEGSRKAVAGFGVPPVLANPIGFFLPAIELAAAAALISPPSAWYGSVVALGLLLLFILGMSVSLARGRAPDCHCFGQLHSEPVGPQSLIRNLILAAIAAFIVLLGRENPGLGATGWLADLTALQQLGVAAAAAIALALAAEAVLGYRLFRGNAQLRTRLASLQSGGDAPTQGLPVGSTAPDFTLRDLDGRTVTLDMLRADGRAVMLLFVDPNCGPCATLMPDVARWQREYQSGMSFALVSTGKPKANRAKVEEHGVSQVLLQKKVEVAEAYKFAGTPSAVMVHPSGTVGSPLVAGTDEVRALLDQYVELLAAEAGVELEGEGEFERALRKAASPLEIGALAPDLELAEPGGRMVRTNDLRGRDTVLLFWGSGCTFCHEMRHDLWDWEANRSDGTPDLVVVVSSEDEAALTRRFRSLVLVDRDRVAAQALHATATPTAVMIDAAGNIASQPLVGASAVFKLLGTRPFQEDRMPA